MAQRALQTSLIKAETSIGSSVVRTIENMGQVAKALVPPVVQAADGRSRPALSVQVNGGDTKLHKSREQRLLHDGKTFQRPCFSQLGEAGGDLQS